MAAVTPTSVPASLDVKPVTKWYITSAGSRIDDGRQHTERIGGEQHDRLGVRAARALGDAGVAVERVGEPGVLGARSVEQIEVLRVGLLDRSFRGAAGTFSIRVPFIDSAAAITGSLSLSRSISLA